MIELRDFTSNGIFNNSSMGLVNEGDITINASTPRSVINTASLFVNTENGSIFIRLDSTFQVIGNTGRFENHGALNGDVFKVDQFIFVSTEGSEFVNTGFMNLEVGMGGILYGVRLWPGSQASNSGEIDMKLIHLSEIGLEVQMNSNFVNEASGSIEINATSPSGAPLIINEGGVLDDQGELIVIIR